MRSFGPTDRQTIFLGCSLIIISSFSFICLRRAFASIVMFLSYQLKYKVIAIPHFSPTPPMEQNVSRNISCIILSGLHVGELLNIPHR
jgi:hypothetical protein